MKRMHRLWAAMLALAAWCHLTGQLLASDTLEWHRGGSDLLERLPADLEAAFSISNAKDLRQGPAGESVQRWMGELNALEGTRRAWALLARRLGVEQGDAFDSLLGGQAVVALARKEAGAPLDWLVLAAVESAMDVRVVRRTRAVPRKIVYGRAVLGLEEESFLLATLPPMGDGRSVLVFAPAGAEWLLVRTLAVSAGRSPALDVRWRAHVPEGANIHGFWRPQSEGDALSPWFWSADEAAHPLSIWANIAGKRVEVGIAPLDPINDSDNPRATDPPTTRSEPTLPASDVLLDIAGPSSAIVSGVLERAGLTGIVPADVQVSRGAGELIVRRGEGLYAQVGARLSVRNVAQAGDKPRTNGPLIGQVRVRPLMETPAAKTVFGPRPEMAWTLLDRNGNGRELVVAVTAGATQPEASSMPPGAIPEAGMALAIVLDAVDRAPPLAVAFRGEAMPRALWELLQGTGDMDAPATPPGGLEGGRVGSLWALVERANWQVETTQGLVQGRLVLELR